MNRVRVLAIAPHAAWLLSAWLFCYCAYQVGWDARAYDLSALIVGSHVMERDPSALYEHDAYYYNLAMSPAFTEAAARLGFLHAATPFVHPPILALIARPLTWIPFTLASKGWLLASMIALGAGLALLAFRYFGRDKFGYGFAVLLCLASFYDPALYAFWLGQTTPFIFLLTVIAMIAPKRFDHVAGAALAVATFVKLVPGLLLLPWLLDKRWRRLQAFGAGIALLAVASLILCGVTLNTTYVRRVLEVSRITLTAHNNQSLAGTLTRAVSPHVDLFAWPNVIPPTWISLLSKLFAASGIAAIIVLVRRRRNEDLVHAAVLLVMLLAPTVSWTHYFVLLIPVALALASNLHGLWRALPFLPLLLLVRPVAVTRQRFGPGPFDCPSTPFLCAMALLLLLVALVRYRGKNTRNVPKRALST